MFVCIFFWGLFVWGARASPWGAARSPPGGAIPGSRGVVCLARHGRGESPCVPRKTQPKPRTETPRGRVQNERVVAMAIIGIRGRTCARISTSLPLPSSPHCEPSTAHTEPRVFHSALFASATAEGSATALHAGALRTARARCCTRALPENTAACARVGATAAMTLIWFVRGGYACRTVRPLRNAKRSTHRRTFLWRAEGDRAGDIHPPKEKDKTAAGSLFATQDGTSLGN